jgi:hypothetical protein
MRFVGTDLPEITALKHVRTGMSTDKLLAPSLAML